jgi:hypothetical protein
MSRFAAIPAGLRAWPGRLRQRLFSRARIHEPVVLAVGAGRDTCLATLAAASRPSTDRLHLRELFREGRRYHLSPTASGFRLYTDTRRWSSNAGRTSPAAVLNGELVFAGDADAPVTLLRLRASVRPAHALAALAFPAFVALIVLASPVDSVWKPLLVGGLLGLALLAQRFDAAYQAHAMVEFVRKALDDLPRAEMRRLDAGRSPAGAAGFSQAWNRFYAEQTRRETP